MADQILEKEKEAKSVKVNIRNNKKKFKTLSQKSIELENSRLNTFTILDKDLKTKKEVSENLQRTRKEINRLMTEKIDLLKIEQKVKDDIKRKEIKCSQIREEISTEEKEVKGLRSRLSSYSNSYIKNKKLSESVDLDQSRLESFLNTEKEAKQELLSEVNQQKMSLQRNRNMNKSFTSRKFISSDLDLESFKSEDSQYVNFDFIDLTNDQHLNEKDFFKSTSGNTAEMVTMATKRSGQTISEFDSKS